MIKLKLFLLKNDIKLSDEEINDLYNLLLEKINEIKRSISNEKLISLIDNYINLIK